MALKAQGEGGPVLGLRNEATPCPLQVARQTAPVPVPAAALTPVLARVLPSVPFNTDRWNSVDAGVTLKAKTFRHAKELPLDDLVTRLSLRDSVLKLDPLDFGVAGGKVSKLMMEKAGLHLREILELSLTGDRLVTLRCAVAGFDVKQGNMRANALIFDTEVTTIVGSGSVDLGEEKLDRTLNQKTKYTSPVALRSPIYLRGSFARPAVKVERGVSPRVRSARWLPAWSIPCRR